LLLLSRDIACLAVSVVFLFLGWRGSRNLLSIGNGAKADMTIAADERECAEQLARFFPKLPAVQIPVHVIPRRYGQARRKETTIVEFGTPEYAIFLSQLALEFDDRIRLARTEGGRSVEAAVVALQYHQGRKAVAVRFLDGPCEWMMQP